MFTLFWIYIDIGKRQNRLNYLIVYVSESIFVSNSKFHVMILTLYIIFRCIGIHPYIYRVRQNNVYTYRERKNFFFLYLSNYDNTNINELYGNAEFFFQQDGEVPHCHHWCMWAYLNENLQAYWVEWRGSLHILLIKHLQTFTYRGPWRMFCITENWIHWWPSNKKLKMHLQ